MGAEFFNLPDMIDALERAIQGNLVFSPARIFNFRTLPDTNTLFLTDPLKRGIVLYALGDLRSFTVGLQLHFPETDVFFGICDERDDPRNGSCWGVFRSAIASTAMRHTAGQWVNQDNVHPVATRELRM